MPGKLALGFSSAGIPLILSINAAGLRGIGCVEPEFRQFVAEFPLDRAQFVDNRLIGIDRIHRPRAEPSAHQHAGERVIVTLLDGIKFVIVTLRTGERRSQERLAERIDHIGDRFLRDAFDGRVVAVPPLAQSQHHRTRSAIRSGPWQGRFAALANRRRSVLAPFGDREHRR